MNNKIKLLILIGSIALFFEVFRLVYSARIDLNNKNICVNQFKKYFKNQYQYANEEIKGLLQADAYKECK